MKKEFSVEEKLEAISYVFQGESARSVSDRLHLGHHLLYEWLDAYRSKGIPGLKPKKKGRSKLPYEERCKIVREYHERELTLHQLSVKYNISESAICTWAKLVERNGFEALASHKSRPSKTYERMVKRLPNWAQAIEELRRNEHADLDVLLELKKMARSTFYYHLKHSKKKDKYREEKDMIYAIFHKHKGRYGYRRITLELRNRNRLINHKTVKKLMDELELKSEVRKVRYRSYKGEVGKTTPNIIDRDFVADRPYQKLATDVTQMTVGGCKIYLSPILDMCDGEILSYTIADAPNLEMVMGMLNQMYERIDLPEGVILHSDQGWHYQHAAYQKSLQKHHIIQSMSRKGNCLDNAMMENFFGLMKSELLYPGKYTSAEVFKKDLIEYIEYYNNERIKLRLNRMSPVQYRTQFQMSNNV